MSEPGSFRGAGGVVVVAVVAATLACAGGAAGPIGAAEVTASCAELTAGGSAGYDAKYNGKVVQVSGAVIGDGVDATDQSLALRGHDEMNGCIAYPAGAALDKARAAKEGELVTLTCAAEGWIISPMLKRCEWVDTPAGVPPVPAPDPAAGEPAGDPAAGDPAGDPAGGGGDGGDGGGGHKAKAGKGKRR